MAKSLRNNEEHEGWESNSGAGMIDGESLKRYVERAANVMREQKALANDLNDICADADKAGFTKREIRRLARESLMDQDVLRQQVDRMEALRFALGGFASTDLGEAAIEREGHNPGRRRRRAAEAMEAAREHLESDDYDRSQFAS